MYDVCEFILDCIKNGEAEKLYPCDIETYIFSDEKSESFEFPYNRWKLQKSIDDSDQKSAIEFLQFANSILPPKLSKEFNQLQEIESDFYSAWQLG